MTACLSFSQSACLFVCLPPCLSVCLSVCLSTLSLCVSLTLYFSVSQLLCLTVCFCPQIYMFLRLFFFDFFHRYSFPSLSMLCKVLVLFLWTVSASLVILCCFFNFFNQVFGFLLFEFLLFSVVLLVLYSHICYGDLKTPFL